MSNFLPASLRHCTLTSAEVNQFAPLALAYIGDAIYELYVRGHYLFPPKRLKAYHQQVVNCVRAEQQANFLVNILMPLLTADEVELVRRGRNASSKPSRKKLSTKVYQQATSFEVLLGYLYLTNQPRLWELLDALPLNNSLDSDPLDAHPLDSDLLASLENNRADLD
ncbi:MAG: ribonuclease III domain-containing protein [Leptolyngbyaceae bacterium]|nr:ribonuclease III domain-containing protein [Leptolyngbyaceae bacterium]